MEKIEQLNNETQEEKSSKNDSEPSKKES